MGSSSCCIADYRACPTGRKCVRLRLRPPPSLGGHEAAAAVGAVAERPVLRLAAAAQGDGVFSGGNDELVAEVIDHLHRPLDQVGAVLATANDKRVGHDLRLLPRRWI